MNNGFEKISPTPAFPGTVNAKKLVGATWIPGNSDVKRFKDYLKPQLRTLQRARCCFCRRVLFDDNVSHLEHFVDRAAHDEFTFEIRNLALSCATCNGAKNGHFLSSASRRAKRAERQKKAFVPRCPVLSVALPAGAPFPTTSGAFRWVSPHIDKYSAHIELSRGWVFRGTSRKGIRTIHGVKLNEIINLERRALSERLEARGGRLSMLVGAIAELDTHKAKEVADAITKVILRRRGLSNK